LNEKSLTITKPGVYFGQCSELCGARHAFMPIVVEALPPEKFAAWVKAQGGTMPGAEYDQVLVQPGFNSILAPLVGGGFGGSGYPSGGVGG
jgi:cytochrome c oxidase subunit 2